MGKISLIIQREYLTRVKKKSFIVMTILGPLLSIAIYAVPIFLATSGKEIKTVVVTDQSRLFGKVLKNSEEVNFTFSDKPESELRKQVLNEEYDALLTIPPLTPEKPEGIKLTSTKNLSLGLVKDIRVSIEEELKAIKLKQSGISQVTLDNLDVKVGVDTKILDKDASKETDSSSGAATIVGFIGALLIYFFIFLYGVQVLRGVMEEKTSRIIEVMISSVKPFELMMGKVVGIALVGLTQFAVWIILSYGIGSVAMVGVTSFLNKGKTVNSKEVTIKAEKAPTAEIADNGPMEKISKSLKTINVPLLLGCFLFYFIGGYLLYGSLFAAVGSAVDSETDSQQFMLPITIPLIVGFMIASSAISDPESSVAVWSSIIPFTSPIVMMVRIPFGVPVWQLVLSMSLLVLTFLGGIWLSGRIYRIGILMYGKKITYKELSKWLFYKI